MIETSYGAASDAGAVRSLNEDRLLAVPPLYFVADGMGGHAAGEVASAIAVETLSALVGRADLRPDDVTAALEDANTRILAAAVANGAMEGMGTTLSGVALGTVADVPHWIVVNVGDSRTYYFDGQLLEQVTVDHSEVEELVAAGRITSDEARVHPLRNVVTRSLGTDPAPPADVWVLPADPDDCYLVCSDGLTNELDDVAICGVMTAATSPQDAADALVAAAVAAGGRDNVSVVVVRLAGAPGTAQEPATDITAPRSMNGAVDV